MLTQKELKELFTYDPETGLFCRIYRTANSTNMLPTVGSINSIGYATLFIEGRNMYAHRLAWLYMTGRWPTHQIDHANMVRSDNRWVNLRDATRSQNHANKHKMPFNRSGLKGVGWHKQAGAWRSRIMHNGKDMSLGLYDCPAAAHFAYIVAADKLQQQFARIS